MPRTELDDLRALPISASRETGYQINQIQNGLDPDDWEPMNTVGQGVQMSSQRFANIWDAIEDTPEVAENMKLRSTLMTALKQHITRARMSQAEAAKLFGMTQPRVSDLMRGKINVFGLDALVNMAAAAGLYIEMHVFEPA